MARPGRIGYPRSMRRVFWRMIAQGATTADAAVSAGVSGTIGRRWFNDSGGMSPICLDEPGGRYLTLSERDEICALHSAGVGVRAIARALGRAPSTISRELTRNRRVRHPYVYRAALAQAKAEERARRPKPAKLSSNPRLRDYVQAGLRARHSPEQIAGRLRLDFPDDECMRISHEAIYQCLYVQGRGALRRELTACLRTGRAVRRPRRRADERRGRIKDKVMISERPAEVEDRAVPGHWEGDLIIGANSASAIGTLVERTTRFTMLLHLPSDHGAIAVQDAICATITTLPAQLRRSLTWDQGIELAGHAAITLATDLPIYFCDPHSPWQRGTNENTNGLLRQYFPKGTNLAVHPPERLAQVADELNTRPRKTLGYRTPAEALNALLSNPPQTGVATTP